MYCNHIRYNHQDSQLLTQLHVAAYDIIVVMTPPDPERQIEKY